MLGFSGCGRIDIMRRFGKDPPEECIFRGRQEGPRCCRPSCLVENLLMAHLCILHTVHLKVNKLLELPRIVAL